MRILVLADTHIPDRARELPKVILDEAKKADMIIHAGDFTDISVLSKLKSITEVKAVYGNMDPVSVRDTLPLKEVIKIGKFKIGVIHGEGAPQGLVDYVKNFFEEKSDCIIFGHAHTPVNKVVNGVLMFNPGSVTDKIFAPYNSYGILELNDQIKAEVIKI
jgi:putative phosphoesterase